MLRGFSSLGAPSLNLSELRQLALNFSLDFLELRAVNASTGLPSLLARGELTDPSEHALPIRLVASDLRLLDAGPVEIEAFFQYAAVADHLGAPYVRIFGGGAVGQELTEDDLTHVAGQLNFCRKEMKCRGFRCEILLETHCAFSSARICRSLNDRLDDPVLILWDSHHTWRRANETPDVAWKLLSTWVRHIHYKDSRMQPDSGIDGCYVVPGHGEFPTELLMKQLRADNYHHGLSLEWEKFWHPELPDLREALPAFVKLTA